MRVEQDPRFTRDYFDPDKRYIGNAVQVFFKDGTSSDRISIDYPVGHRRRRGEGIPLLMAKFDAAVAAKLPERQVAALRALVSEPAQLLGQPVTGLMHLLQG
jgi:2-methylcitrate dehydratase